MIKETVWLKREIKEFLQYALDDSHVYTDFVKWLFSKRKPGAYSPARKEIEIFVYVWLKRPIDTKQSDSDRAGEYAPGFLCIYMYIHTFVYTYILALSLFARENTRRVFSLRTIISQNLCKRDCRPVRTVKTDFFFEKNHFTKSLHTTWLLWLSPS